MQSNCFRLRNAHGAFWLPDPSSVTSSHQGQPAPQGITVLGEVFIQRSALNDDFCFHVVENFGESNIVWTLDAAKILFYFFTVIYCMKSIYRFHIPQLSYRLQNVFSWSRSNFEPKIVKQWSKFGAGQVVCIIVCINCLENLKNTFLWEIILQGHIFLHQKSQSK